MSTCARWPAVLALVLTACGEAPPCLEHSGPTCLLELDAERAREQCLFPPGTLADSSVGDLQPLREHLRNVLVVLQENRSFDHLLGTLGHGTDGIPAGFGNTTGDGTRVTPHRLTSPCSPNPDHSWDATHRAWHGGAMDRFAAVLGPDALGYYDKVDHPFYSWLYTTFAMSDRMFASLLGSTWPNWDYLLAGTSRSIHDTGDAPLLSPTVLDVLSARGISWTSYVSGGPPFHGAALAPDLPWHTRGRDEVLEDLDRGTLPEVAFLEGGDADEHPPHSLHDGEAFVRNVVDHAFRSPQWPHLAIILAYDEGGGFFDHVPPPAACRPDPTQWEFDRLGIRVPLVVISPYARPGHVSHRVHSHASILRLLEALHGLPAFTSRDANADALLDLFDFDAAAFSTPPVDLPAAASGGC